MDVKAKGLCGCHGQTDFLTRERGLWMSGQKELCGCQGMRNFVDVKAKGLCGCQGQTDIILQEKGFMGVKAKRTLDLSRPNRPYIKRKEIYGAELACILMFIIDSRWRHCIQIF